MDKGLLKQIYVKACASFFLPRPHEETILRERQCQQMERDLGVFGRRVRYLG